MNCCATDPSMWMQTRLIRLKLSECPFPHLRTMEDAQPAKRYRRSPRLSEAGTVAVAKAQDDSFDETKAEDSRRLTDGVRLSHGDVLLPWVGYGTYKLGKEVSRSCTLEALRQGYRLLDTAFIYGGETTEKEVGLAIQDAISENLLKREDLIIETKHWRSYHGYDKTLECLRLSLKRLQVDVIDVWLMHWPGPAWKHWSQQKKSASKGLWANALIQEDEMPKIRSETWRAMEHAQKTGKVKAIGVSNFSIAHLERLKKTATIWPPAVNQIECHPLNPQDELLEYCAKEGIVVQAYSSLGGQDAGKAFWKRIYGTKVKKLVDAPPVQALTEQVGRTPAQVLLRWGIEKNMVIIPKASSVEHMIDNANVFDFRLTQEQQEELETALQSDIAKAAELDPKETVTSLSRLCWRRDPLRLLQFH